MKQFLTRKNIYLWHVMMFLATVSALSSFKVWELGEEWCCVNDSGAPKMQNETILRRVTPSRVITMQHALVLAINQQQP